MKKIALLSLTLLIAIPMVANAKRLSPENSTQTLDRVVALVNNDIITERELRIAMKRATKAAETQHLHLPKKEELRTLILNQLINEQLMLQVAKHQGITATPQEVTARIALIRKINHLSKPAFEKKVKMDGYTLAEFRKKVLADITINRIKERAIGDKIDVKESKVNELYANYQKSAKNATQYHLIDILTATPDEASPTVLKEKHQESLKTKQQLKNGVDFQTLSNGDDDDLGWRAASEIPEVFARHLSSMHKGSVVGPIKTGNGYHVIRLEGIRKSQATIPSKKRIRLFLRMQAAQNAIKAWVSNLRKQAYISIK